MGLIQKIKFLWQLRKSAKKLGGIKGMKRGIKTSEFWGKVVIQIIAIVGALSGTISPELATLVIGIIEGLYGIGRSIVKFKGGELPPIPK